MPSSHTPRASSCRSADGFLTLSKWQKFDVDWRLLLAHYGLPYFSMKECSQFKVSCLSWKWRKRSSVKIMERTYEERAQALHCEEKVAVLRRHLLDKVPVSDLCEELSLKPTVFYRWQKEFFENGAAAFQAQERPHRQVEEKQKRIEFLEKKVQTKNEVLAELMAEHVALKKTLGDSNRQLGAA